MPRVPSAIFSALRRTGDPFRRCTINIPTRSVTRRRRILRLVKMLRESVPNADKVIFSTHCHNDLGLAVANSLAGVLAGARQVDAPSRLGERAGNAALERDVMREGTPRRLCLATGHRHAMLARASKLVSNAPISRCSITRRSSARTPQPRSGIIRRHAEERGDLRDHASRDVG